MITAKYTALLALGLLALTASEEIKPRRRYEDPFAALDRHITHTLSHHYLWPWNQLLRAAAALDAEDSLEEPQIISDKSKFIVNLNVKRFKPDELRVRIKNRNIIVEGKHKEADDNVKGFFANHFVQRFILPAGCKEEEVVAVLKEKGVLSVSAPKHELPPPPPEREVPIEVLLPLETTSQPTDISSEKYAETTSKEVDNSQKSVETSSEKNKEAIETSSVKPIEHVEFVEATTHVGKIRKKELKPTKTTKDNEVTKGIDGNGLDYALIESE